MTEVTVTIVEKRPPGPGKTMWDLVDDNGKKYKAFPAEAALFDAGKRYQFTIEHREHNGYPFNVTKGAPKLAEGPPGSTPASIPAPQKLLNGDPGPHAGMWEKEASGLIERGMAITEVPDHIAQCILAVRAGLRKAEEALAKPETPSVSLEETLDF